MLRKMLAFPVAAYLRRVYMNVLEVTVAAVAVVWLMPLEVLSGCGDFVLNVAVCVACAGLSILFIGCSKTERSELLQMVLRRLRHD
jgi:hypothetical protein